MLALLPLIGIALGSLGIARRYPRLGLRGAFLAANIGYGAFAYLSAEALGALHLLTAPAVTLAWLCVVGMNAVVLARQRVASVKLELPSSKLALALTLPTVVLMVVTAVLGLLGPANTYDGLLYHLPRLMHWRQDASLAFYPSQVLPQLHHPPFAEVMMLHTVLLSGSDGLVNMVSWWCYAASIVGVSAVARQLGAAPPVQALGALLAASIPVAVLQASGPKNDLALSFWLICLTWALLRWMDRRSINGALLSGVALGLALATKGSAALFAAPIIAAIGVIHLWRRGPSIKAALAGYALMTLLGVAIATPQALRNVQLFGSVLGAPYDGPTPAFAYASTAYDPPRLASAIVRAVGSQLGTPWESINRATDLAIRGWHRWANLDIDDPAITWGNRSFYVVSMTALQEESAPNPLSILLITCALIAGMSRWRELSVSARCLLVALPLSFVLYCALIKWQPATTRFQLPLIMLWCPLIAVILGRQSAPAIMLIAVAAVLGSLPAVLDNRWRPLTGDLNVFTGDRAALALGLRADRKQSYDRAADIVNQRSCQRLALELAWDDLEYPWRRLLPGARIEHINVRNVSARLPYPNPEPLAPCAAISLLSAPVEQLSVDGLTLAAVSSEDGITVYLPSGQMPPVTLQYSVRYELSLPSTWQPDATEHYRITLVNTGWETWSTSPGYTLSASFGHETDEPNEPWETERRTRLPSAVGPGESITLDGALQAPSRPGTYTVRHRLLREGSPWFGQIDRQVVTVAQPGRQRRR